jgi:hypothetical protein
MISAASAYGPRPDDLVCDTTHSSNEESCKSGRFRHLLRFNHSSHFVLSHEPRLHPVAYPRDGPSKVEYEDHDGNGRCPKSLAPTQTHQTLGLCVASGVLSCWQLSKTPSRIGIAYLVGKISVMPGSYHSGFSVLGCPPSSAC